MRLLSLALIGFLVLRLVQEGSKSIIQYPEESLTEKSPNLSPLRDVLVHVQDQELSKNCVCHCPLIERYKKVKGLFKIWIGSNKLHWFWLSKIFISFFVVQVSKGFVQLLVLSGLNALRWEDGLQFSEYGDVAVFFVLVIFCLVAQILQGSPRGRVEL